jgi:twitching motility protein PilT
MRVSTDLPQREHQYPSKSGPVFFSNVKPMKSPEAAVAAQVQADESTQTDKAGLLRYGPGVTLPSLLQQTIELHASDLHVHSGATLRVRRDGKMCDATPAVLTSQECEGLIKGILNEPQLKRLEQEFQVDFAYEIPGVGRFRANVYKQQRGFDAVFRAIKLRPPTLAELGLPKEFERYTEFHQGLVLFTGPAGCGKSSTMAAMVDLINKSRPDHILTIEDPIEYVHNSASCNVTQREVGAQTESFAKALRAALREDPDVIVIGELRDLETISMAVTAAETGHLVLATLHTSNVIRTINRLLGVFPPDQLSQIRRMLSESLKVVISQRLVQRADGRGRVAALEVMINNNAVANLIRENRTFQIKSILQTGGAQGQRLLDASLTKLLKDKVITRKEAIKYAEEVRGFDGQN